MYDFGCRSRATSNRRLQSGINVSYLVFSPRELRAGRLFLVSVFPVLLVLLPELMMFSYVLDFHAE